MPWQPRLPRERHARWRPALLIAFAIAVLLAVLTMTVVLDLDFGSESASTRTAGPEAGYVRPMVWRNYQADGGSVVATNIRSDTPGYLMIALGPESFVRAPLRPTPGSSGQYDLSFQFTVRPLPDSGSMEVTVALGGDDELSSGGAESRLIMSRPLADNRSVTESFTFNFAGLQHPGYPRQIPMLVAELKASGNEKYTPVYLIVSDKPVEPSGPGFGWW